MRSTKSALAGVVMALCQVMLPVAWAGPSVSGAVSLVALYNINYDTDVCGTDCIQSVIIPQFQGTLGFGDASGGVSFAPSPSVTSGYAGGKQYGNGGLATLDYSFEWYGPPGPPGSIPTDIDLLLQASAVADASDPWAVSSADADFGLGNYFLQVDCTVAGGQRFCDPEFDGTLHFSLSPNTPYLVDLHTDGANSDWDYDTNMSGGTDQAGFAIADPHIYLDPSYNNVNAYQLILSDGIGNGVGGPPTSAPEPATLALLGAGLAGLGFSRQRKLK